MEAEIATNRSYLQALDSCIRPDNFAILSDSPRSVTSSG
jgi:hypothetical protein